MLKISNKLREEIKKKIINKEFNCEKELTLSVIGGKWKLVILWHLGFEGPHRFNEINRLFNKISHRVLTKQLRELELDGIINRTVYPSKPPKVEYSITEMGKTLLPIVQAMYEWGKEHMDYYVQKIDEE
ncbi:winged helix-turn-helix transcriptional regulator [Oceanirhabdus sp. W0125-5]|uniref:winged helix-turn-helix transcriptional regulator n=1 Tax=Oceanirhabdus sp. W0125-5 TaxID=2999116 RepID=UPI0022F2C404|nr:helix-turn-helix domain-containing protein [Oceanirhabdus sp. W0125-5]WBW97279.1 helix-turn-helix domain-containing protein [Oceanirhabdus sp. W0125-5]